MHKQRAPIGHHATTQLHYRSTNKMQRGSPSDYNLAEKKPVFSERLFRFLFCFNFFMFQRSSTFFLFVCTAVCLQLIFLKHCFHFPLLFFFQLGGIIISSLFLGVWNIKFSLLPFYACTQDLTFCTKIKLFFHWGNIEDSRRRSLL